MKSTELSYFHRKYIGIGSVVKKWYHYIINDLFLMTEHNDKTFYAWDLFDTVEPL